MKRNSCTTTIIRLTACILLPALLSCAPHGGADALERYLADSTVDRILIVTHTEGCSADAGFFAKKDGAWEPLFMTDAFIGKNGMGKEKEGDGKTPAGDFPVTGAFGILPDPGSGIGYLQVTESTFACDEEGPFYNTIIDTAKVHHECHGEDMSKLVPQYNYGLSVGYNPENAYPKGSAIFVHCKGPRPYTGGCVAISEEKMRILVENTRPGMRIVIE